MRRVLFAVLLSFCACKSGKDKPQDLNAPFTDPAMKVAEFVEVFEAEDRAVYVNRDAIAEALNIKEGSAVADIGAGTGFFVEPLAKRVGDSGEVFAVEISPNFLKHLREMAKKEPRLKVVEGKSDAVPVAENSLDLILIVDTYHHFDRPKAMLQSMMKSLKPGGRVALIDFIRIPGTTTDKWVLGHVRAGEKEFTQEFEAAGFKKLAAPKLPFFKMVYLAIFQKPAA